MPFVFLIIFINVGRVGINNHSIVSHIDFFSYSVSVTVFFFVVVSVLSLSCF